MRKVVKVFNKTGGRKHCPSCDSISLKPILLDKESGHIYGYGCTKCGYTNLKKYKDFRTKY